MQALSAQTGAVISAHNAQSNINWALPTAPLALFSYQTYDFQQYYVISLFTTSVI